MSHYYDEQTEFLPEQRNGIYGTYPGRKGDELRGILRNKTPVSSRPTMDSLRDAPSVDSEGRVPCGCIDGLLRPLISEFLAVYLSLLLFNHINSELSERHAAPLVRLCVLAVADASVVLTFVSAFKTVHLNPSISIAQLFSLSTSWYLCVLFIGVQFVAATLAFITHAALKGRNVVSSVSIQQDVSVDWSQAVYNLVLAQSLGAILVVMTHLMIVEPRTVSSVRIGRLAESPLCLFFGVLVSAFLSLLQSSISWNPLQASAVAVYQSLFGYNENVWDNHYVFWIGPVMGALFTGVLYRILFAGDDRRLIRCSRERRDSIDVTA